MLVDRIITGMLEENCYILSIGKDALIVDPGDDAEEIIKYVNNKKYNVLGILITHHHFDHVGALEEVKNEYKAARIVDFKDNGVINIKPFNFKIIKTFGHTDDSVTYYFEKDNIYFTGDFVFQGTIGNFPDEYENDMRDSLNVFKTFNKDAKVYPGHGEDTTVEYELETNPFLRSF